MSNQGYLRCKNHLRMRGKYLNVFGEYAESIYASMEKTQKGSWRILQIHQELPTPFFLEIALSFIHLKGRHVSAGINIVVP